jgi:hypothetical protein
VRNRSVKHYVEKRECRGICKNIIFREGMGVRKNDNESVCEERIFTCVHYALCDERGLRAC